MLKSYKSHLKADTVVCDKSMVSVELKVDRFWYPLEPS
jgi:hypothetical protein